MSETYSELPDPVQLLAVCHTEGCSAEGEPSQGTYYPVGGFDPPRYMGQCGRCQQPITDLRAAPDPGPGSDPVPEEPAPPVPIEPSAG